MLHSSYDLAPRQVVTLANTSGKLVLSLSLLRFTATLKISHQSSFHKYNATLNSSDFSSPAVFKTFRHFADRVRQCSALYPGIPNKLVYFQ